MITKNCKSFYYQCSFSVGISDLFIHNDFKESEKVLKAKEDVIDITKKTHLNILTEVSMSDASMFM